MRKPTFKALACLSIMPPSMLMQVKKTLCLRTRRTTTKKRANPFIDLYKLLTVKTRRKLYLKQLYDGTVYVYNRKFLLASFQYYGGSNIINLRLNTKAYLGKKIYPKLRLADYFIHGGNELRTKLEELFPNANECNVHMKNAYELAIIEAAIRDQSTPIEITNKTASKFDVAIVSQPYFISCSFRYLRRSGRLRHVFLRYASTVKDIRLPLIRCPKKLQPLFEALLTRELIPIPA